MRLASEKGTWAFSSWPGTFCMGASPDSGNGWVQSLNSLTIPHAGLSRLLGLFLILHEEGVVYIC